MFDEVGVDKKPGTYTKGDWEKYAVHGPNEIRGFFSEYRWLSNFYDTPVYFDGVLYRSSESAYQAAKVIPSQRSVFENCKAYDAKRMWRDSKLVKLYSAADWDNVKYDIMLAVVFDKFYRNVELRDKLVSTRGAYLEELNHWSDQYWGVDIRMGGCNNLGQILMIVRKVWSINQKTYAISPVP